MLRLLPRGDKENVCLGKKNEAFPEKPLREDSRETLKRKIRYKNAVTDEICTIRV